MPLTPDLTTYTTASPSILSVSFQEFATKVGTINLYNILTEDSVGTSPIITSTLDYRGSVAKVDTLSTPYEFVLSDITEPFIVEGNMKFNFVAGGLSTAAAGARTIFYTIVIKKNATTLATAITQTHTNSNGTTPSSEFFSIIKAIPRTPFNKGDELKITYTVTAAGAGWTDWYMYIDNGNQSKTGSGTEAAIDSAVTPTINRVGVPIKV